MRKIIVGVMFMVILSSCSLGSGHTDGPTQKTVKLEPINIGICLDGNVDPALGTDFVKESRGVIADAFKRATETAYIDYRNGNAGRPAINVSVRKALPDPMLPSALVVSFTIPEIPAVAKEPKVTDPGYLGKLGPWRETKKHSQDAVYDGRANVTKAAETLRTIPTDSPSSNIAGCVSALARDFDGKPSTIVLVSDLYEGVHSELFRLDGVNLLIVSTCSRPEQCEERHGVWAPRFQSAGAHVETISNIELLPRKLDGFLGTK